MMLAELERLVNSFRVLIGSYTKSKKDCNKYPNLRAWFPRPQTNDI